MWKPRALKLDALPYDDVDFAGVLDALAAHGFVVKYEAAGRVYGCIPRAASATFMTNCGSVACPR